MKKLKADWKCDWCPFEYSSNTPERPQGWHEVNVMVDGALPAITRHFCCKEHLDAWKEAAGL